MQEEECILLFDTLKKQHLIKTVIDILDGFKGF